MRFIPYGKQNIDNNDIREVIKALKSDLITQGPMVQKFEKRVAEYCRVKYALAVSSGTAALHLACLAAGLKKGDEAITSPITFVATSNAVLYTGARPVFVDIDYETMNISAGKIKEKITATTKAILSVNFAGLPCDMFEIYNIARRHGLIVIEDSCHALGSEYNESRTGSCRYSDMSIFSFHPVKHVTTGEGGMVTTNSKRFYEKMLALRSHGIYKRKEALRKNGGWYYEMLDIGFNYRMTELQAALGYSQMNKLPEFLVRRSAIASMYDKAFNENLGDLVKLPAVDFPDRTHAWHLYVLRLNEKRCRISRRGLYQRLHDKGIGAQVHYIPVTSHPYYRSKGYKTSEFCNAQRFYNNTISLPLHPGMSDKEVLYVAKTVIGVLCSRSVQ
ncbi:MAG: UDP-4-amino-4,6-dideoxy-N-acetyl-beta-L-altrosamine transaminase [Candidatus Omnitrophota bacterium]|nr:UDP-4-amino-4,6-dideoxy-N-acetyl-beta-L-altrosamine transaminase [Candidatus Omnitrophota bacterium]